MYLTKKKAIQECKELWQAIADSGFSKDSFLQTKKGKFWLGKDYFCDCPLCEYNAQREEREIACGACPLVVQLNKYCSELGFAHEDDPQAFNKVVQSLKE